MLKIRFIIPLLLLLFSIADLKSQNGVIQGYVMREIVADSSTMEKTSDTLLFSKVVLLETPYKAYTLSRTKKKYVISDVPAGLYTVQASTKDKSLRKTLENIEIKSGDTTFLNINLSFDAIRDTNRIVVRLEKEKKDAGALELEKIKEDVVTEKKGKEEIAKTGGGNVAKATKSISGVSVVGGKYVFIRGLSDRYSKTVLNNAEIPGLDPNTNSVQLDLFPSSFIGSLDIIKTYTPDLPGDWAGGLLDLKTRSFPDSLTMSVKFGLGLNNQSSFNSNFLTYKGSATDFLGFDGGARKLPSEIQAAVDNGTVNSLFPSFPSSLEIGENTERLNKQFSRQLTSTKRTSFMNYNASFTIGNKKTWVGKNQVDTLIKKKFGYFAGLSYKKNFTYFNNGEKNRYSLPSAVSEINSLNLERDFDFERSSEVVTVGALFHAKYIPNKDNKLSLNVIRNHSGESRTEFSQGELADEDDQTLFINTLRYTQRAMNTLQFLGEHDIFSQDSSKQFFRNGERRKAVIDWTTSYTLASQNEPDYRVSPYFRNDLDSTFFFNTSAIIAPTRFYRNMNEFVLDHKLNLSFARELKNQELLEFKTGLSSVYKNRQFSEFRFELSAPSENLNEVGGNVDGLLTDESFDFVDFATFNDISTYGSNFQSSSQYRASQHVAAGYGKVKVPITKRMSFVGGARYEYTNLSLFSDNGDSASLIKHDILPSVNFNYAIIDNKKVPSRLHSTKKDSRNLKLRLGYNRTLARPSFREIAPYAVDDFEAGVLVQGNPELDRSIIDNFDLRLEYYPRALEIFSVSLFYKNITNPIELRSPPESGGREFKYSQGEQGIVYGVELDVKKRLDFIHRSLSSMTVGSNVTVSASAIDIAEVELKTIRELDPEHADTRPLFGQSPYIINAFWELEPDTSKQSKSFKGSVLSKMTRGMLFRVNFNMFGDRLSTVIFGGAPDIYEVSRADLGVVISKQLTERMKLSVKGSNLLNPEFKQVYKFIGDDPDYDTFNEQEFAFVNFKKGVNVSASLSIKF